jgi:hypothetical protein
LRELVERDRLLEALRDFAAVPLDPFRDLVPDRLDPLRDFALLPDEREEPLDDDFRWVLGAVLLGDERALA